MTDTRFNEPIDTQKPLSGTSRQGYAVPPEAQRKVIDIIIEEARKMGFNNRDLAYYIAIAKRESSFNPDAANPNGTASGIAQAIDSTAATYGVNDSNRFDARSSIKAGLGYFRDLKAETIQDYGSAAGKFEPLIYDRYHYGEYATRRSEKVPVAKGKGTRAATSAAIRSGKNSTPRATPPGKPRKPRNRSCASRKARRHPTAPSWPRCEPRSTSSARPPPMPTPPC